ncbi:MAG: aminotransferase class I/II-fold pyridoxal phosphate-dependent enzyme [Proteobacteria bacterium]|nr:aminotransferase class I/II-fold pyridoxal phosphate-dependent enzyme [Pseudomonadota bacterium]
MRDFALEVYFSRWEFTARYNLAGSDGENRTLAQLLALATPAERDEFVQLGLGYTETWGSAPLREAIAATYERISPRQLLCFAGAEEAIFAAMHVLLERDDHAIVITPNYQSAETLPLSRCAVSAVSLDPERTWALDVDRLEAALRPNTRLISINFPNNPTGKIIPPATIAAIVELCRRRGLWLFSDECYRLLERDPAVRLPQAADVYERALSLNVMSKAYGLAGLRLGWIACQDRAVLERLERFKHFLSICNAAPSEVLARIALRAREQILAENVAVVRANLAVLDRFFADYRHLFDWHVPEGGCISFIRYRGADGVEAFTARAVEECGVLLLPASVFRSELATVPPDFLRIGFGRSHVPRGVDVLRDWLRRSGR